MTDQLEEVIQPKPVESPAEEWVPTHRFVGTELDGLEIKHVCFKNWRDKDGNIHKTSPTRKAVKITRLDRVKESVSPELSGFRKGHQTGLRKGLEMAGFPEDDIVRMLASEKPKMLDTSKYAIFETRHLATAFQAVLGAHDHIGLCVDGQNCEGEYRGRFDNGDYHIVSRIFDWQTKEHYIHHIRIPQKMMVQVLEEW